MRWPMPMHGCLSEGRELCTVSLFARHWQHGKRNVVLSVFAAFYSSQ